MKYLSYYAFLTLIVVACKGQSLEKGASFKEKAQKAIETKEYATAIVAAKEALKNYASLSDTLGIIEANYLMARASALSDNFEDAQLYGEAGSQLCKLKANYSMEYQLNNTLSWAYYMLGKGFEETMEHQKRQLFVVEQLEDNQSKAMVYNNYGYDVTVAGTVPITEAIDYMKFANDHYAKTENNNGRWYTLMNLTWQHRLINDLPASEKFGRMSAEQAEKEQDRHAIIEANANLGETLLLQNKLEEAKPLYERGLELSKEKDDRDKYVFDVYHAQYLWETGQKEAAMVKLKTAITFLETSEIFYEMLGRAFLATYSHEMKDMEEAKRQLAAFKSPRATYFSQESSVMATLIEAQMMTDKEKAMEVLENKLLELDKSGAELLKTNVTDLLNQLK